MTTVDPGKTHIKIEEIIVELKQNCLWSKTEPAWVKNYEAQKIFLQDDFAEWLQFVYLPNFMPGKTSAAPSIVPQARKYFGDDVKKGKLLQLLIELDALL